MENPPISEWKIHQQQLLLLGEEFRFQGLEVRGYVDNSLPTVLPRDSTLGACSQLESRHLGSQPQTPLVHPNSSKSIQERCNNCKRRDHLCNKKMTTCGNFWPQEGETSRIRRTWYGNFSELSFVQRAPTAEV